jgi:DNA-binding winged helix-turn-helix (wHTH) protein/tetratricopeptide (TPR) repeat protein
LDSPYFFIIEPVATETDLQFDGWTVNRVSGEISRGGRSARLPQQPLRILLELADHAGEVVTREQLVKVLWPAGIVDFDNGLNVAVRKLRVALDDVGEVPRYIETLPRVGYRFIGKRGAASSSLAAEPRRARTGSRITLVVSIAALAIALGLGWWLGAGGSITNDSAHEQPRHVPSVRAQELYLEGLSMRSRRDIETGTMARAKFEAALREDPQYAQAWAALGESISAGVLRQLIPPAEGIPQARAAAQRAIALDDNLVEGHYLLGQIYMDYDKDFAAARREYDRALAINDKAARLYHHLGMFEGHLGHLDQALASLRRARELEPMTLLYAGNYGLLLYEARRYDEAIAFLRPLVEANPRFDQARSVLARAMMATGDFDGARAQLLARTQPGPNQSDLGMLYAKLGRRDDALREIERLELRGREGFGVAYDQALIFVALGDLDQGCEKLRRAITDHSMLVNWMRLDPPLDPLRGRQCYADAQKRLYGDL